MQIKSPVELIVGTLRLARSLRWPTLEVHDVTLASGYMGQQLFGPPSRGGLARG